MLYSYKRLQLLKSDLNTFQIIQPDALFENAEVAVCWVFLPQVTQGHGLATSESSQPAAAVGESRGSGGCCRLARRRAGRGARRAPCAAGSGCPGSIRAPGHGARPGRHHHMPGRAAPPLRAGAGSPQAAAPGSRSRAVSPRSGQPLYLRFPGKQFLFVTEKSPALVEEGGALPPLHAKGPLLVLIFSLKSGTKPASAHSKPLKVFVFVWMSFFGLFVFCFFFPGRAEEQGWGIFVCWFSPLGSLFLWYCVFFPS